MKLSLVGHDYKYAVEQMMMTLFPDQRPEYSPATLLPGELSLRSQLTMGKKWVTAVAEIHLNGDVSRKMCRGSVAQLNEKVHRDRTLQHIIKLSIYRAAVDILGCEPPWGALTGVRPVKLPTRAIQNGATPAQARRELHQVFRVSSPRCDLAMDCVSACLDVANSLTEKDISLYIGIPFCPSRCAYCSFISADVKRSLSLVKPYVDALMAEVDAAAKQLAATGRTVRSVYIGGGTPTTLSAEQLTNLMSHVQRSIDLSHCTEYTVEGGRPETITADKIAAIARFGGTRISVNPQTMEDHVLVAMGRDHKASQTLEAYQLVRNASNLAVNMDLIAGLPEDSVDGFCKSLDTVLSLDPENITVHTLALKKGARLKDGSVHLPEGPEVSKMLDYAWTTLRQAGYRPYYLYRQKFMSGSFENVGWCKPGFESVYNICMMEELHTVLSLGSGGVTKCIGGGGRLERIVNPKYPKEYIDHIDEICATKEGLQWPTN